MTPDPATPSISPAPTTKPQTWQTRIQRVCLLLVILIALTPLTPHQLGLITTHSAGFRLVMLLVLSLNAWWWTAADTALAKLPLRRKPFFRLALAFLCLMIAAPLIPMLITGSVISFTRLPTTYIAGIQLWYMSLAFLVPLFLLARFFVHLRDARLARMSPSATTPTTATSAPSRRDILRAGVTFAPAAAITSVAIYAGRQTGGFQINRHDIPAPWLPSRLRGLTITHISDLHVGRLYRPAFLPRLVEKANNLRSDLIVITGDLVDASNQMLPPMIAAVQQLHAPHGKFLCMGNHDQIDNRDELITAVRRASLDLLIDQSRTLTIGGESLRIAGLDWTGHDTGPTSHAAHLVATLPDFNPARDPACIALAHHPHAFDALAAAGIPLTLSGHTHGGQIMFHPPDPQGRTSPDLDTGFGSAMFRYVRGFYHRNASTLFVNMGVGNWFPLRINAPAEITQLRLI